MAELTILDGAVGTVLQNDRQKKVALNMGSAGGPLEPLGTLSFDAAYESYAQVVRAGDRAGADLVVVEAMTDLADVRAAVLAVRETV